MGSEKRLSFSPFQKRSRVRAFSGGEIIREWGLDINFIFYIMDCNKLQKHFTTSAEPFFEGS